MIYILIATTLLFAFGYFYLALKMAHFSDENTKELAEMTRKMQGFIDKNINERVVYTTQDQGYTNVEKFDNEPAPEEPKETIEMTPEMVEEDITRKAEGK